MTESVFPTNSVNQVRQAHKRGIYDRKAVFDILDANLIGNVGFVTDGIPYVIPMLYARQDDELLFHGSTKSRLIQLLCSGQTVCVSTTVLDGLVLAKSLMHHSMNYRSVCVFGQGRRVDDESERLAALKLLTEKTMPGRWHDARHPNSREMKATGIAALKIDSASAKVRSGPPVDDKEDLSLPVWAGVVPITSNALEPVECAEASTLPVPHYLAKWIKNFNHE